MGDVILAIDQSTSGTKGLLFGADGGLLARTDVAHRQIITERGWVEHDLNEIYNNTLAAARQVVEKAGVRHGDIRGVGISNQRETAALWDRETGEPLCNAIVWQCPRAHEICSQLEQLGCAEQVQRITGLPLSPYYTAAKLAWAAQQLPSFSQLSHKGRLCCGTIDSWLLYKLTREKAFKTDVSNASRTQLFDIGTMEWSETACQLFGIPAQALAQVCDSDAMFGTTDFGEFLNEPVPVFGVLGDSHGALFAQGCLTPGMVKATYGTGASVMVNVGPRPIEAQNGLAASVAWRVNGSTNYVLEGNIHYAGAVLNWLRDGVGILKDAHLAGEIAAAANPADETYLVPAFTGLGAPWWRPEARAAFVGMGRGTGKAELIRAAEESIAYQIVDVLRAMQRTVPELAIQALYADGGATRDRFLMQFQSDIAGIPVAVSPTEELSGAGAAYVAGMRARLYKQREPSNDREADYLPLMPVQLREEKYSGWLAAVGRL